MFAMGKGGDILFHLVGPRKLSIQLPSQASANAGEYGCQDRVLWRGVHTGVHR